MNPDKITQRTSAAFDPLGLLSNIGFAVRPNLLDASKSFWVWAQPMKVGPYWLIPWPTVIFSHNSPWPSNVYKLKLFGRTRCCKISEHHEDRSRGWDMSCLCVCEINRPAHVNILRTINKSNNSQDVCLGNASWPHEINWYSRWFRNDKDFHTWLLIGWRYCHQPIIRQVIKSL